MRARLELSWVPLLLVLGAPARLGAEPCRRDCTAGETRDPRGCCLKAVVPVQSPKKRAPRSVAPPVASCPTGKLASPDTAGHCCWPGQAYAETGCIGVPTACPEGHRSSAATQSCELEVCAEGRARASDGVHCCWPKQAWAVSSKTCLGVPQCPAGTHVVAEKQTCEPNQWEAKMVGVSAATFLMGCAEAVDRDCEDDERPSRQVSVSAFELDASEVTQGAYQACVTTGVCTAPAGEFEPERKAGYPVVMVTWDQAKTYCHWVRKRLPTEAEWERAARGTDRRIFPWGGDEPSCTRGNFSGCAEGPKPNGSHPTGASPVGAEDLAGNVWEWVADWKAPYTEATKPVVDPRGPREGLLRVVRGGSFATDRRGARVSRRGESEPGRADRTIGFRCASPE